MAITSDAAAVRELEGRLKRPDRGENGYREGRETRTRLETIKRLREFADDGKVKREGKAGGINTHVHTAKSFAYFDSPSDAVWQAYLSKVAIFGINDHYTLAGHEEFGKACKSLSIKPIFSMEAVALWEVALKAKATVNDPANPGRTYLTAKGVTRALTPGGAAEEDLRRMNAALLKRNQQITEKLGKLIASKLKAKVSIRWEDVLALTPHGQPTERHICLAAALWIEQTYPDVAKRSSAVVKLVGEEVPDGTLEAAATFQDFLRSRLLKVGKPAYVEEASDAFIPLERLVRLGLDLGAIPTYPILGNPISPWEEDLDKLFDRLEAANIHAVEVIPNRNTRERLAAIVAKAAERHYPIFNGTEHNTRTAMPLVDKFFFDDEFRAHFERGARVLLGHQSLKSSGKQGYVQDDGSLFSGGRAESIKRVEDAGRKRVPA